MNKKRILAIMVALAMVATLVPVGVFGLAAEAHETEYQSPHEMETTPAANEEVSTEGNTDYAGDASYDYGAEEENAPEENTTEEKPSYEYEEDASDEASDEASDDPTGEEEGTDDEEDPTEDPTLVLDGSGFALPDVFFSFYPQELVVQSYELFGATADELNAILLSGVSAVDEFGNLFEVAVKCDGGLAQFVFYPDAFDEDLLFDAENWEILYFVEYMGGGQ